MLRRLSALRDQIGAVSGKIASLRSTPTSNPNPTHYPLPITHYPLPITLTLREQVWQPELDAAQSTSSQLEATRIRVEHHAP